MALVNNDTRLCDIVMQEPTTVTVLNRFGIRLGVGHKTVAEACEGLNIDASFLATILNTYLSREYFPEKTLAAFSIPVIIDYLKKTNAYHLHFQLPNIERHFFHLMGKADSSSNNLAVIRSFFDEIKKEFTERIKHDEQHLFPELASGNGSETDIEAQRHPDSVEDKLDDLANMIVIHLSGDCDQNLCYAVLQSIVALKVDVAKNNRIRERILLQAHHATTTASSNGQ